VERVNWWCCYAVSGAEFDAGRLWLCAGGFVCGRLGEFDCSCVDGVVCDAWRPDELESSDVVTCGVWHGAASFAMSG